MVQILPSRTDVGSAIGAGLGQGLGQGIARGAEVGFQRNLVNQSLAGLENLPAGTTPAQLATHLIRATAGIPGAERYVGTLYNALLPQLQAQQQRNLPEPGQPGPFGQGASATGGIKGQPQLPIELP